MSRFFSPSTGGFYSEAVHGARQRAVGQSKREIAAGKRPRMEDNPDCRIPGDAIPVDPLRYQQLFEAQSNGKTIVVRGGKPVAIDPVASAAERAAAQRRQRDRLLFASDWTQLPDTLADDPALKADWADYRSDLRGFDFAGGDLPQPPETAQPSETRA